MEILEKLQKSKFRNSFHLNKKMKEFILLNGLDKIEKDAYNIINQRIKPKYPKNDGKQTPMKQVHPVFISQHATATCCRSCLEKWHKIPKEKELDEKEVNYIVNLIMNYIKKEMENI